MIRISPYMRFKIHPKKNRAITLMAITALLGAGCGKKQEMVFDRPPAPVTIAAAWTRTCRSTWIRSANASRVKWSRFGPRYPDELRISTLPTART